MVIKLRIIEERECRLRAPKNPYEEKLKKSLKKQNETRKKNLQK